MFTSNGKGLTPKAFKNDLVTRSISACVGVPYQFLWLVTLCAAGLLFPFPSQAQNLPKPAQNDDVIRVNTELVQTDVMVFDKKGNFVDGLRPEQFKLSLDGQPHTVSIFERVTSGSGFEASQLATLRAGSPASVPGNPTTAARAPTGRLIFFFVDDVHLSGESLVRARQTLLHFVDNQMNPGDKIAIVSTSGQIGFLQQLTDHPAVLRTAISRLNYKRNAEGYAGKTRITDYMASQVADAGNPQLFAYLMESVKIEYGMGLGARRGDHGNDSGGQAARLLRSRVGQINAQGRADTANTIAVLKSLMQSSANLPGRKLVFFLSDGFIVDPRGSSALNLLHEATQVAARSGAVIYSVDMRGSFLEAAVDASSSDYVDMTSRHSGVALGEIIAPREPLNVLAEETGGRTIVNSSAIDDALEQAVRETSDYYVLAWRPGAENERNAKARLELTIPGRPDLRVRLRRSYYVANAETAKPRNSNPADATPEALLLSTLGAAQPLRTLPTSLSVGYVKTNEGLLLQTAMQIPREAFTMNPSSAKPRSEVDVIGAAVDDRGLIYTFKQVLTVTPQTTEELTQVPVVWNQQLSVRPGLYQVRVAVRERGTNRVGSAMEWIEIPSLAPAAFSMSSLFLGERPVENSWAARSPGGPQPIRVDVDHRFARISVLRFQTFIYNAARNAGSPDVWIEAHVLRGTQPVMVVAPTRIPPDVSQDPSRLPYWSEIALNQLLPGSYTLEVSATDKAGGASSSQRINFTVE
jgi:VWFA-related protein